MTLRLAKAVLMDKPHKTLPMGLLIARLAVLFSLVCLIATIVMLVS